MRGFEEVKVDGLPQLDEWLRQNHAQKESVWLVTAKKSDLQRYISYSDMVDTLLCWGWIDGLARGREDGFKMQLISPRKPKSAWSAINKTKVAELEKAGRIQPPGMRAIEVSRANGMWEFLDDVEALVIPPDLAEALLNSPVAAEFRQALPLSQQKATLQQLKMVKSPEARARRIAKLIEAWANHRRL